MSCIYSRALVEAYWRGSSSDIAPSGPSRSIRIAKTSYVHVRMMRRYLLSLSSPTSKNSTPRHLTTTRRSLQEGSPVRRSAQRHEVATTQKISGRKCGGSSKKSNRRLCSQRTLKKPRSNAQLEISSIWVTDVEQCRYPRKTWVLTTFEIGSGFLATPTETANQDAPSMMKWPGCRNFVQVFGRVSPVAYEWLMGLPSGWTDVEPLGMRRFQLWLCSHTNT